MALEAQAHHCSVDNSKLDLVTSIGRIDELRADYDSGVALTDDLMVLVGVDREHVIESIVHHLANVSHRDAFLKGLLAPRDQRQIVRLEEPRTDKVAIPSTQVALDYSPTATIIWLVRGARKILRV